MNFTPLNDFVAVRPDDPEERTEGGIIIPETSQEKPMRGTILAAGPGTLKDGKRLALSVREGDVVLYGRYAGNMIEIDGDEVLIMREVDIFGTINGGKKK